MRKGIGYAIAKQKEYQTYNTGIEWAQTLVLCALHDMYGFGKNRFIEVLEHWNDTLLENKGTYEYAPVWRKEMETYQGLNRRQLEMCTRKLESCINSCKTSSKIREKTADILTGTFVSMYHILVKHFHFGRKRLAALQQKIADMTYVINKDEVPMYEFMECLYQECGVNFDYLKEYVKVYGRPLIYG